MPAKTAFFAEWHRFPPIFPTADASPTFGMTRENWWHENPEGSVILILAHSVGKTHIFTGVFDPKVSKLALFSGEIGKFFHRKVQNQNCCGRTAPVSPGRGFLL
jgi:hypothetical protein